MSYSIHIETLQIIQMFFGICKDFWKPIFTFHFHLSDYWGLPFMNKRVPEILCVWMISKLSCWQGGRRGMSAFGNMSMRHKNAFTVLVKGSPELCSTHRSIVRTKTAPAISYPEHLQVCTSKIHRTGCQHKLGSPLAQQYGGQDDGWYSFSWTLLYVFFLFVSAVSLQCMH